VPDFSAHAFRFIKIRAQRVDHLPVPVALTGIFNEPLDGHLHVVQLPIDDLIFLAFHKIRCGRRRVNRLFSRRLTAALAIGPLFDVRNAPHVLSLAPGFGYRFAIDTGLAPNLPVALSRVARNEFD